MAFLLDVSRRAEERAFACKICDWGPLNVILLSVYIICLCLYLLQGVPKNCLKSVIISKNG